jgi:hypothetical protein
MACQTPKQINRVVPKGDKACWPYLIHEGVALVVTAQAESGATEIRLDAPESTVPAFPIGTVIDIEISEGNYHRIEVTAATSEGHDAGQAYRTVEIQSLGTTTLNRRIAKSTKAYVTSDISARVFSADLINAETKTVVQNYNNAAINQDDGTAANRGRIEITVSDTTSADLVVDLVTGGQSIQRWIQKSLPIQGVDSTNPYKYRVELDELIGGQSVQFSYGVVVVSPGLVVA